MSPLRLPRLRKRRPAPRSADPPPASPAAPALEVLAYAKSGLPEEEFSAQTEALRRILAFDGDTRSWYAWLPLDDPGRAAEVLNGLFEAARAHGTAVQVRAQPPAEGSPAGQVP